MIIEAVRLVVTLATTAAGFLIGRAVPDWYQDAAIDPDVSIVTGAVLGAGVGYVAGGLLGRAIRRALDRAPDLVARASGPELFAGTFGMLVGVLIGVVLGLPLVVFLPRVLGWPTASLLVLVLAAFGSRIFAVRSDDLLATAGLRPRRIRPGRTSGESASVVDTSAVIDGRVLEMARSALIGGNVIVPQFIVDELQGIADSGSIHHRRRGRRGLDVLTALGELPDVDLRIADDVVPEHDDVDAKLITLCDRIQATLISTDHNLIKAAGLRGIPTLNPHAIGEALRPQLAPGDRLTLLIERTGTEPGQGVGYLDDGTMVVVEEAAGLVGSSIDIEVANTLRTSVGRLLFARPAS
jgi:uncharacterized protein YacL